MTAELRCRCGRTVRIVRLNAKTLVLGHESNPGTDHHPVRLAPAVRNAAIPVAATGQPEAPESGSGFAGSARSALRSRASESGASFQGRGVHASGRALGQGNGSPLSTRPDPDPLRATSPSPSRSRAPRALPLDGSSAAARSAGALSGRRGR